MANPLQHPDGNFYYRSGGEIVSCSEDMSGAYPNDMISPDDSEMVEKWKTFSETQYQRDRAPAYPSVGDQLDMMMKDMKNGTTTHQEACEAVKAKFPKP